MDTYIKFIPCTLIFQEFLCGNTVPSVSFEYVSVTLFMTIIAQN